MYYEHVLNCAAANGTSGNGAGKGGEQMIKKVGVPSIVAATFFVTALFSSVSADTHLVISGNGRGSDNEVNVESNNTTRIVQSNDTDIDNDINVDANTGGNSASRNTGGDVRIGTGDVDTDISVSNMAGFNYARVDGCNGCDDISAKISGNGSYSDNSVDIASGSNTTVVQNNDTDIDNDINVDANTGDNDANRNTWGDVTIRTGDVNTDVSVNNKAGFNYADVAGCSDCGDIGIEISGNGSHSRNSVDYGNDKDHDYDNDFDHKRLDDKDYPKKHDYDHDYDKDRTYHKDFDRNYDHKKNDHDRDYDYSYDHDKKDHNYYSKKDYDNKFSDDHGKQYVFAKKHDYDRDKYEKKDNDDHMKDYKFVKKNYDNGDKNHYDGYQKHDTDCDWDTWNWKYDHDTYNTCDHDKKHSKYYPTKVVYVPVVLKKYDHDKHFSKDWKKDKRVEKDNKHAFAKKFHKSNEGNKFAYGHYKPAKHVSYKHANYC
jgi:hypothetical protein